MKTITVTINPDGTSIVEAQGFTGKACQDATKEMERALGVVGETKLKSEYYRKEQIRTHAKVNGNSN